MKLTAIHVDTCLSCYWGGGTLATLQTTVWKHMTLQELKDGLHQERIQGAWAGSDDRTRDDHDQYEAFNEAAKAAIDALEAKEPGATLFPDLEERIEDDDGEEIYAFFVFQDEGED